MDGIVVSGLAKSFPAPDGGRRRALDGVTLSADRGIICILGPNGSGKTTLFKTLCGLILPDSGEVRVAGFDALRQTAEAQRRVGFSPGDERSFYGRLSCLENLRFFAGLRGIGRGELKDRLKRLEPVLRLEEMLPVRYHQTSSGMKQRLSLARAFVHDPPVLILDEPTKSLDPEGAQRLRDYIRDEAAGPRGRLVLWSTHLIDEAWAIASRVVVLSGGIVRAQGSPADLQTKAAAGSPLETYLKAAGSAP